MRLRSTAIYLVISVIILSVISPVVDGAPAARKPIVLEIRTVNHSDQSIQTNITDASILRVLGEIDNYGGLAFTEPVSESILDIDSFALDLEFMNLSMSHINGSARIIPFDQAEVSGLVSLHLRIHSRVQPIDTNGDAIWDTTYIYITTDGSRDDTVRKEVRSYIAEHNERVPANMKLDLLIHSEDDEEVHDVTLIFIGIVAVALILLVATRHIDRKK